MKTAHDIEYKSAATYSKWTIPAGTKVIPADNLPQGGYWAEPWEGIDAMGKSWARNYGFHIDAADVIQDRPAAKHIFVVGMPKYDWGKTQ